MGAPGKYLVYFGTFNCSSVSTYSLDVGLIVCVKDNDNVVLREIISIPFKQ